MVQQAYLNFIKYSIENSRNLPANYKEIDWGDFLSYCNRQGIVGVVFDGIMKADIRDIGENLFEWISFLESIKARNQLVNKRVLGVTQYFLKKGRRSCILKGQANGLMYPNPEVRCPGDIDIWVEGKREDIIKSVLEKWPNAHYSIHHVKMPIYKEVMVEVHYRPIYLSNWVLDKKLQRYIEEQEERQFQNKKKFDEGEIGCLTHEFDAVYQMLHMYHHFFETRNNIKQFVDYYYLLRESLSQEDKEKCVIFFKEFKVYKYASGIMWIMKEVLGLHSSYLIMDPNEKEGRLILRESFYFGTYPANKLLRVAEIIKSNLCIIRRYPMEVMVHPFFLLWHLLWKLKIKKRLWK